MNKETIKKAFREWKKVTGADYALTSVDRFGWCMSDVNCELSFKYGEESKGIWLKHWNHGVNSSAPLEECDSALIAHDIDEEQAEAIYEVFGRYFHVLPEQYSPHTCFSLYEKTDNVYRVTYEDEWDGEKRTYHDFYANIEDATHHAEWLHGIGHDATLELYRPKEKTIKAEQRVNERTTSAVYPYSELERLMQDDSVNFIMDNETGETLYIALR